MFSFYTSRLGQVVCGSLESVVCNTLDVFVCEGMRLSFFRLFSSESLETSVRKMFVMTLQDMKTGIVL
jgi:hypothetical protein